MRSIKTTDQYFTLQNVITFCKMQNQSIQPLHWKIIQSISSFQYLSTSLFSSLHIFEFSSGHFSYNILFFLLHFSIFQTAVLLWMPDPAARDAEIIWKSLVVDRNLEAATEVICSRTPSQLQYLKQLYHSKFGVYLEQEIELNTSGDHQKVRFLCVNVVYVEHEVEWNPYRDHKTVVASLVLVCGF